MRHGHRVIQRCIDVEINDTLSRFLPRKKLNCQGGKCQRTENEIRACQRDHKWCGDMGSCPGIVENCHDGGRIHHGSDNGT